MGQSSYFKVPRRVSRSRRGLKLQQLSRYKKHASSALLFEPGLAGPAAGVNSEDVGESQQYQRREEHDHLELLVSVNGHPLLTVWSDPSCDSVSSWVVPHEVPSRVGHPQHRYARVVSAVLFGQ